MEAWMFWLALMLVLLVVEVLVVDLVFIMFAGGAFAAGVAGLLGAPIVVQVIVFGVVSTLLLVAIRPWALRRFRKPEAATATNVNALTGKPAVVLAPTSEDGGRVKLAGEVWSARYDGEGVLPEGTDVTVVRIDGATAVVTLPVTDAPGLPPHPSDPYGTRHP